MISYMIIQVTEANMEQLGTDRSVEQTRHILREMRGLNQTRRKEHQTETGVHYREDSNPFWDVESSLKFDPYR